MQIEAANCLLKTLEEPSSNLHFVLITHQLERILPTIRSRCLLFSIPKPPINEAISWLSTQLPDKWTAPLLAQRLSLHSGAPLKVMASINDKALDESIITNQLAKFKSLHTGEIIDLLSQNSILEILNCILKWSFDLNLVLFGQQVRYFPQFEEKMKSSCLAMNKIHFQQFLSGLKDDLRLANHPLFPKVQLEAVLMKYTQLFK
jgi:DNA polymerase-3 subunit delta'